jgi:uncharacterized membrane protein (UPF0182 family)
LLLVTAAIVFLLVPSLVEFYSDWLWFGEVGYQSVFLKTLSTQALLAAVAFVAVFVLLFFNLHLALRAARRREFLVMTPDGPRTVVVDPMRLRPVLFAAAGIGGVVAALYGSSLWDTWLFYRHATPFGEADPILGHDVSFFVFGLPFYHAVQGFLLTAIGVTTVAVAVGYFLAGSLSVDAFRGLRATPPAVSHLSVLAAAIFLVLAFGAWLGQADMLTSPSGIIHGASYADVEARLPMLRVLLVVAVAGAALAAVQAVTARRWPIALAIGAYIVVALGGAAYAAFVQRFSVAPNEQTKETPYIVHNVAATRKAFALDTIVERELSGDALLSRDDIDRNAATLKNVPLWNHQPLLDTFSQIQEIRTYYDFVSVHNDRYWIDGEYRQIMLSARELNSDSLPNRTWINERLTFTHGYGLTLGPVNQVTPEGLPVLFIKNLPPETTVDLKVSQPAIYYGELPNDHVFVTTRTREFDYPRGDDNVYTTYAGDGGVSVGSFLRKALFSIRFRSIKTLLSNDLTPDSRVLYYRRIAERVRKIAPFLTYEDDRYLAIAGGRLFWIQDAYTTSGRYPYSSPAVPGVNYIRNSVKAVVDAYHGHTRFYLVDPGDPIAATISRVFPGLLRPLAEMPEGLRGRLRYPQGIFGLQVSMFSTYHMTNPAVFYNKEDQWEVPSIESVGERPSRMLPYYTIMKLHGEDRAEFIQMLPLTPRQKDNLAAWMVARSDDPNYGRLLVFQFPKQKVIFGPRQVVARINQDQVIAPQITLWNQQGSEVIQGNLLVIPIEESMIYIRPLYLRSAGGRIPELKRVIVAYQNQIVMEETLDNALNRIFTRGGGATPVSGIGPTAATIAPAAGQPVAAPPTTPTGAPPPATPAPPAALIDAGASRDELIAAARAAYERAVRAQREGNWAQYGEEIERLGKILERLSGKS